MLDTYAKLKKWIETNVPKKSMGLPTVREAAIWFVCIQEAEVMCDCTQKDLAAYVELGMKPMNTTKAVTEWLGEFYDECEDENETEEALVEKLKDHFSV